MEEYKVTFKKSDMLSFVTIDSETIFKRIPAYLHYQKTAITVTVDLESRQIVMPAIAWKQGHGVHHIILEVAKHCNIEIDDYIRLRVSIDENGSIRFSPYTLRSEMLKNDRE